MWSGGGGVRHGSTIALKSAYVLQLLHLGIGHATPGRQAKRRLARGDLRGRWWECCWIGELVWLCPDA